TAPVGTYRGRSNDLPNTAAAWTRRSKVVLGLPSGRTAAPKMTMTGMGIPRIRALLRPLITRIRAVRRSRITRIRARPVSLIARIRAHHPSAAGQAKEYPAAFAASPNFPRRALPPPLRRDTLARLGQRGGMADGNRTA